MSRYPRISSDTGIYHAILRGVNKQQIFECDEDYEQFVRILMRQCGQIADLRPAEDRPNELLLRQLRGEEEPEVERPERHCYIYAWCLLGNHVHLLIKGVGEEIGDVIKRISSSYVYYYKHKYDRIGHLYQERFKSEPVEDWDYFLTLLRYIHQNPLKPRLVKDLKDYPWSSWQEYLGMSTRPFCSTAAVFKRISLKDLTDIVTKPMTENEEEGILEYEPKGKKNGFTDADVWRMIETYSGARNLSEFQKFDRPVLECEFQLFHAA